jgi:hypothetical protein
MVNFDGKGIVIPSEVTEDGFQPPNRYSKRSRWSTNLAGGRIAVCAKMCSTELNLHASQYN